MSDAHTSRRFDWLKAIAADGRLHSSAVRVAIVIADHINRQSGEAFPSIKTIATKSATPERTVERAVADLCKAGFLEKRRGGFGKSNRYSIAGADLGADIPATGGGTEDAITAMGGGTETSSAAMGGGSFPPPVAVHSRHGWRTNPLIEPSEEEPSEKKNISPKRRSNDAIAQEFEEFWTQFPRKVAKGRALKAFKTARKTADLATILAGALRYSQERTGQDHQFTKHPATWLTAECWADEAAPSATAISLPARNSNFQTGKDRTLSALQHLRAKDGTHG